MREDQADKMITELKWISWGLVKIPLICGAFALFVVVFTECGTSLSKKVKGYDDSDHLEGLGRGLSDTPVPSDGDLLPVITNAPPSD